MYNLIESSDNYSKALQQYYRNELVLIDAGDLDNSSGNSASFRFKQKVTGSTGNDGTK